MISIRSRQRWRGDRLMLKKTMQLPSRKSRTSLCTQECSSHHRHTRSDNPSIMLLAMSWRPTVVQTPVLCSTSLLVQQLWWCHLRWDCRMLLQEYGRSRHHNLVNMTTERYFRCATADRSKQSTVIRIMWPSQQVSRQYEGLRWKDSVDNHSKCLIIHGLLTRASVLVSCPW